MAPKKIRVAVLYGGRSSEHEVSLRSAAHVIQRLDSARFDVTPIKINKQGKWVLGKNINNIDFFNIDSLTSASSASTEALTFPDKTCLDILNTPLNTQTDISNFLSTIVVEKARTRFDVIFPVIHGPLCEDGTIQGLLEVADLPYVGCGVLASAIGMDKDVSKRLVKQAGIPTTPHVTIKHSEWNVNPDRCSERIHNALRYPLFVKPCNAGSSVGIKKVIHKKALAKAIENAFEYDTKIVVEQGIDAIEIEFAVLESLIPGQQPIVSIPGEIRPAPQHEFYSYESKYLDENGAELYIPAPISDALTEKATAYARDIFLALECEGMARVDLFIERNTHEIYFNEINSIPGFTDISMYPKLMMASGIGYTELLNHLVMLAIHRHTQKTRLAREYLSPEICA